MYGVPCRWQAIENTKLRKESKAQTHKSCAHCTHISPEVPFPPRGGVERKNGKTFLPHTPGLAGAGARCLGGFGDEVFLAAKPMACHRMAVWLRLALAQSLIKCQPVLCSKVGRRASQARSSAEMARYGERESTATLSGSPNTVLLKNSPQLQLSTIHYATAGRYLNSTDLLVEPVSMVPMVSPGTRQQLGAASEERKVYDRIKCS